MNNQVHGTALATSIDDVYIYLCISYLYSYPCYILLSYALTRTSYAL